MSDRRIADEGRRSCWRGSRRRGALLDETDDPDQAIDILQELAELAKETEAELQRAKRAAETEAATPPDAADA